MVVSGNLHSQASAKASSGDLGRKPWDTLPECIRGKESVPQDGPRPALGAKCNILWDLSEVESLERNADSDHYCDTLLTTCLENMGYIFLTLDLPCCSFPHFRVPPSSLDNPSPVRGANTGPCTGIMFPLYPTAPTSHDSLFPRCV